MNETTRQALLALKRPAIDDPIAELVLGIRFPDGHQENQILRVGRPCEIDGFFACAIQSIGPVELLSPLVGDNSFQALNLALTNILNNLTQFVNVSKCTLLYGDRPINLRNLEKLFFRA